MQNGSLTIGDISLNYGNGTNWTTNTSGLLLECLDNTEIAIHGNRVVSFMIMEIELFHLCNIKGGHLQCLQLVVICFGGQFL